MAAFSTMDALNTLCSSIPNWNARLNELNTQIALRQIELARLDEEQRGGREEPTARSLRNKGSTESLRPNDHIGPLPEEINQPPSNPFLDSPQPIQNGFHPAPATLAGTDILPLSNLPLKAPPGAGLIRQCSQPNPHTHPRIASAIMKKRKTESLASGESKAPKYRTRSMIIVYYDSTVQTAFEELVKFVSGSRNAMRKGKMAAKMAEMRRAAEMEAAADEEAEEDDGLNGNETLGFVQTNGSTGKVGEILAPSLGDDDGDLAMPKLRYVSTRNMGPSRDYIRAGGFGSSVGAGLLRGYRRGGDASAPDIFDELDNGLEWCQSQCEHAAHQFLRDGDCTQEIENIKRKLVEVKDTAEREVEKLKKDEAEIPLKPTRKAVSEMGKSRELKSVQMRKELGTMKDLEVDDMTVDEDEGIDDMEPPKLIFKRSRDVGV